MADGRGRPRSFDSELVLNQALELFWERGYLGTSYAELCLATGLTKPSLYAAFGNKEATFLAALERYNERYIKPGNVDLKSESNAHDAVRHLLSVTVDWLTAKSVPNGCMIVTNAACLDAPDVPDPVCEALRVASTQTRSAIAERLDSALADKQIAPETDTAALAVYFDAIIIGLSGLAKQGVSHQELMKIVDNAMRIWPAKSKK